MRIYFKKTTPTGRTKIFSKVIRPKTWRKDTLFGGVWYKGNKKIETIQYPGQRWGMVKPTPTTYEVRLKREDKFANPISNKILKANLSKKQLDNYLKSYMRKH